MARLDDAIWRDPRGAVAQFRDAQARGDDSYLYFAFHDWMVNPPQLPARLQDKVRVHRGRQAVADLDGVAAVFPATSSQWELVDDAAWVGTTLHVTGPTSVDAFAVATPWALDNRLAFLVYHSWIERSALAPLGADMPAQIALHERLVHTLAADGYVGMVTRHASPVVRAFATRQLDWYRQASDALAGATVGATV